MLEGLADNLGKETRPVLKLRGEMYGSERIKEDLSGLV